MYTLLVSGCILLAFAFFLLRVRPFSYRPAPAAINLIGQATGAQTLDLGGAGRYYVFPPRPGTDRETGFVFYPGGLVDAQAYAPLMDAVAREGYLAVIAAMPLDLAVLGSKRAGVIMGRYPGIRNWVLGGHSLGGVMACRYAGSADAPGLAGVILLASYPSKRYRLDHLPLKVMSIFGTLDGLTTLEDIAASKQHLPEGTDFVEIQGGNHSQFCSLARRDQLYRGDNPAAITVAQQQEEIIRAVVHFLKNL